MTGPVAIVAAGELFGGAERHILGLGAFLRERGLDPRVVVFHDRELAARCRDDGLPVEVLRLRSGFDRSAGRRLGDVLARHDVQVAHVHGYQAAFYTALAPGRFGMAVTLHGQGEPVWTRPRTYLKDRLYRALEVWACRRRRAAVCFVTDDLRRRHGGRYRGLERVTVHNGITSLDRDLYRQRPEGLDSRRLHAVMAGRLSPVKGIEHAIGAMARLTPDHPWQLDLVGDGVLRGRLESLAQRLGVADRVTFHGFRRDVEALMAHADLLLMTSLHEGLPYTLLEAMSLGLPVVASDVGGLAEVLRHEETALLVPVGDVDGFAAALDRLGGDEDLRRRLGAAAAAEQRRSYTLRAMGEKYLAVYEAVAGGRR